MSRIRTNKTLNIQDYVPLARAQQVYLQKTGPMFGASANMWLDYDQNSWWDILVDETKWATRTVRCYGKYNLAYTPYFRNTSSGIYTRCVKMGSGWKESPVTNFSISGLPYDDLESSTPTLQIMIWTSDIVAFLPNGTVPPDFPKLCLQKTMWNQTAPNYCDWNKFFAESSTVLHERSRLMTTIQIDMLTDDDQNKEHPKLTTFTVDFVAHKGFAQYSLDPSSSTNPMYLTTTSLPKEHDPIWTIPVHPAWYLYAWSADLGATSNINRGAALELANAIYQFWETRFFTHPDPLSLANMDIDVVSIVPIMQMLSLIDYDTNSTLSFPGLLVNDSHPLLTMNARIYVWAYGMTSRTAYFRVFVATCGCVVVVLQFVLGFVDRRKYRSRAQLLVAALEYQYKADFVGILREDRKVARVRYRLEDADYMAGKFKFYKVD